MNVKIEKLQNDKMDSIVQFIKFGIVGVANTAVDWIVFYLLVNVLTDINHSWAKAISFTVAMLNSYLWNTIWTFSKEYKKAAVGGSEKSAIFVKFIAVSLFGWGVNVLAFNWSSNNLHFVIVDKDLLPLVVASASAIVWNFFANKFWTYKK